MPPRAALTSSFSVGDAGQEVVCPLHNQDGSSCRKRCLGEKRYRSMQEHIRRAHPEYYLPKLPATKESFELMINSPPHDPPAQDPNHANHHRHNSHGQIQQLPQQHQPHLHTQQHQQHAVHHPHHQHHHSDPSGLSPRFTLDAALNSSLQGYHSLDHHDGGYYTTSDTEAAVIYDNMQAQQRSSDEYRRGSLIPAASAAAALAQLHSYRPGPDWAGTGDLEQVILPSLQMSPTLAEADFLQNFFAEHPPADLKHNHFHVDPTLEEAAFIHEPEHDPNSRPDGNDADQANTGFVVGVGLDQQLLPPSSMPHSSPDRLNTLPPLLQRGLARQYNRPRKGSLTQHARLPKHERRRSRELGKRLSGDRKAFSAEPTAASLYGKRWEDLIDAAASATEEEGSRDLTPIPASPYQSPQVPSRTSLPPFALGSQFHSFQASPLTRALTPPPQPESNLDMQPFPSVESSLSSVSHQHHNSADSSGSQFHIMNPNSLTSPSEASPVFNPHHHGSISQQGDGAGGGNGIAGPVQIYCAGCRRLSILKDAYACTNCICGLCGDCVSAIINGQNRGRLSTCPRCNVLDTGFKPFQLDLR